MFGYCKFLWHRTCQTIPASHTEVGVRELLVWEAYEGLVGSQTVHAAQKGAGGVESLRWDPIRISALATPSIPKML